MGKQRNSSTTNIRRKTYHYLHDEFDTIHPFYPNSLSFDVQPNLDPDNRETNSITNPNKAGIVMEQMFHLKEGEESPENSIISTIKYLV